MNQETQEVFQKLEKALIRLTEAIKKPISPDLLEIDGTIQRFEFCIELFWKALQKKLSTEYDILEQSPRKVLQKAYVNNLITNEKVWLAMIQDRNLTSHTYQQEIANRIYKNIKDYVPFLQEQFAHVSKIKNS